MKALQCRALGPPENLRLEELPDPVPGQEQVVVDVRAAGVNFPDGLIVAGTYQTKLDPPLIPGSEVAGTVRSLGNGVTGLAVGQRVTAYCGTGGYAEQVAVDAARVHPIPDGMSFPDAAVLPVAYGTTYHALVDRARLRRGETLLVLGASGGVGLAAVGMGHAIGARVIAAASTDEKLDLCARHGADERLDYSADDLGTRLKQLTDGAGVDVVYDPVGGAAAETVVRRLAWGARYLTIGYASGDIPKIGMNRFLVKEADLLGVFWGRWASRNLERNDENMRTLFEWCHEARLRPRVNPPWPLAEGAAALNTVLHRDVLGKIVLAVQEG